MIAYTQKERAAVKLGDPIGPEEDVRSVIGAFKEFCAKVDWQPAARRSGVDRGRLWRKSNPQLFKTQNLR